MEEIEMMKSITATINKYFPDYKKVQFQENTIINVPRLTRQEIVGRIGLDNWSYFSIERYIKHSGNKFEMCFVLEELLENVERYN